jgi:hypothetical protein
MSLDISSIPSRITSLRVPRDASTDQNSDESSFSSNRGMRNRQSLSR